MAYANHDLQMPLTHESCCRPGGGRVSIPAQECKAGLSLGLADQESRTSPEIQTPAAPEPAPPQPSPWLLRPDPLLPTSALSGCGLLPPSLQVGSEATLRPLPKQGERFLIRFLSAPQDQN